MQTKRFGGFVVTFVVIADGTEASRLNFKPFKPEKEI